MRKYKFTQYKDKFTWSNGKIKLQFSNPSTQAFDEYTYIKDDSEIMHYYYTVKIFKNVATDYDDELDKTIYKWKLVTKRSTYDFPTIQQLKVILNHILYEVNPIKDGQKHEYRSGDMEYSYTIQTEGFGCDDFYEVTKYVDSDNKTQHYNLYIGCTFDSQGDRNSEGIRTPYVYEDDIKELYKCVDGFIKYSVLQNNAKVKKWIDEETSNKKIVNGKIYEYEDGFIENIYIVGDICDVTALEYDDGIPHSNDRCYKDKIISIENNTVCFERGGNLQINNIVHLFQQVSEEKLKYGVKEIALDFIDILNEEERHEFIDKSNDELFNKYKRAIMNRTWMCRNEHGFGGNPDEFKTVYKVVRKVIDEIKRIL